MRLSVRNAGRAFAACTRCCSAGPSAGLCNSCFAKSRDNNGSPVCFSGKRDDAMMAAGRAGIGIKSETSATSEMNGNMRMRNNISAAGGWKGGNRRKLFGGDAHEIGPSAQAPSALRSWLVESTGSRSAGFAISTQHATRRRRAPSALHNRKRGGHTFGPGL